MKTKKIRTVLSLILVFIILVGTFMGIRQFVQYRQAEQSYGLARDTAHTDGMLNTEYVPLSDLPRESAPLSEDMGFLWELDIEALQATNEDVIGWIVIPDSEIDYPLLQGEDNEYYLNAAWDGTHNIAGSIFMECRNNTNFSDFNTIIYGHNMRNGSMFASLKDYSEQEYYEKHPEIYIVDENGVKRYEVVSAYYADVTWDTYRLVFNDEVTKQKLLEFSTAQSEIETELTPNVKDRILTLSTCTGHGDYNYRWVVQAVLTGVFEAQDE